MDDFRRLITEYDDGYIEEKEFWSRVMDIVSIKLYELTGSEVDQYNNGEIR